MLQLSPITLMGTSEMPSSTWEALLKAAGNPETEIVRWMREGAPTGFDPDNPIIPQGIFPPVKKLSAAIEQSRTFAEVEGKFQEKAHANYRSYYEHEDLSEKEVDRLVDSGFVSCSLHGLWWLVSGLMPLPLAWRPLWKSVLAARSSSAS